MCEANGYVAPVGCVDECHSILPATAENLLAEDWVLEELAVTITASQFWAAVAATERLFWPNPAANQLARLLSLEDAK